MKCDSSSGESSSGDSSAAGKMAWTAPVAADLTTMCYIDGKCVDNGANPSMGRSGVDKSKECDVARSTSAYSPVKGYLVSPHSA